MGKYKELFSNAAVFAVSNVLSKVVLSLLLPLYTRMLTTLEYGTAELLTTISQLAIPVSSLAIQDAVFRFCMDKNIRNEDVLKTSSIIVLLAGSILAVISFSLKWYEPLQEWKCFFYFVSLLSMIRAIFSLYVKAKGKTIVFSIDNVLYNLSLALSNIIFLAVLKYKLSGYFYAMILANIISLLYLLIFGNIRTDFINGKYDSILIKDMLIYSTPLVLNSISWGLTHLTDKIMLASFCSTSATGIYSAASKIPSLLSMVTSVFCQAWTLSAIRDYENDRDRIFYKNIFLLSHIGAIGCAMGIFLFNNNLLLYILGDSFCEAVQYVPVLIIGTVFLTYSNFYSPIYSAIKKSKQIMYSSFLGMIVNIVLNSILIPRLGIMGACFATAISYIFIGIYRMIDSRKYLLLDFSIYKLLITWISMIAVSILVTLNKFAIIAPVVGTAIIVCIHYGEFRKGLEKVRQIKQKG